MKKGKPVSCYNQACRYLAFRDHSRRELVDKLVKKEFTSDQIDEVIASLINSGYIDDEAYALRYGRGRKNRSGLGPLRVRLDLVRKGFDIPVVEKTMAELFTDAEEEMALSIKAARKKTRTFKAGIEKEAMKKKLFDFLIRQGYSAETARTVALSRFEELQSGNEPSDE